MQISCATPGATVRYTVDGSTPTQQSSSYSDPFQITETTLVKAVAFLNGWHESLTTISQFSILSGSPQSQIFTRVAPTEQAQLVLIQNIQIPDAQLQVGDEIGLFDGNLCVGSRSYTGGMPMTLDLWLSSGIDMPGGVAGHPMSCKVWSQDLSGVVSATAEFLEGDGTIGDEVMQILHLNARTDTVYAFVSGQPSGNEGSAIQFDAGLSFSPEGLFLKYDWDWNGDGTYDVTSIQPETTAVFGNDGWFNVGLRVTDTEEISAETTVPVEIKNVPPVMSTFASTTVSEGANFSVSSITFDDPALSQEAYSVEVDWGDGETTQGQAIKNPPHIEANHVYADDGKYSVQVQLEDGDGGIATQDFDVTVLNVRPRLSQFGDKVALKNIPFQLNGLFLSDPAGVNDTYKGNVYWGDGAIEPVTIGEYVDSAAVRATHAYADSGSYIVSVLVSDDDGGRDTSTFNIHVFSEDVSPPEIKLNCPADGGSWIPLNSDILLVLDDDYYGIDRQSMNIKLNNNDLVKQGENTIGDALTIKTFNLGYEIRYRDPNLNSETNYQISIQCTDRAQTPNQLNRILTFRTGTVETEEIASKTITPFGGIVGNSNDVRVIVPNEALDFNTSISINRSELPLALPDTAKNIDRIYYMNPDGLVFSKSATIEIPFYMPDLSGEGVFDKNQLCIYVLSAGSEIWESVDNALLDDEQNLISFKSDHFSYYVLAAWQPAMAPFKSGEWLSVFNYFGYFFFVFCRFQFFN